MLIAHQLLDLIVRADLGQQAGRATLPQALAAAVVSDLAVAGLVAYDAGADRLSAAGDPPSDPALEAAHVLVREKPLPISLVVNRLALEPLKDLLRQTSATEGTHTGSDALDRVLAGEEPDEPTAALVTLLAACELTGRVTDHPDQSAKAVAARAHEVAHSDWGTEASRAVVRAAATAASQPSYVSAIDRVATF